MITKVRQMRAAAGLTQQQLAELVHVSARTIISIEKGQYSPSLMLAYHGARVRHNGGTALLPGGKPAAGGGAV